ncbi:unnamed protein product, partial [Didymodactylos carnosus]
PLPRSYAREDTHYLLYISDILRNKLLDMKPKLLQQVYEKPKNVAKDIAVTRFYYNRLPELVQEKLHRINEIILQRINHLSDNNLPVIPSYEPKKLTNTKSIAVKHRPSIPVTLGLIDSQRDLSPDMT